MQLTDPSTTFTAPRLGSTSVVYPCVLVTKLVRNATNKGTEINNHWEIWEVYTNHFVCNITAFVRSEQKKWLVNFFKLWCFHINVWVFLSSLNLQCLKKKETHPFRTYGTSDPEEQNPPVQYLTMYLTMLLFTKPIYNQHSIRSAE